MTTTLEANYLDRAVCEYFQKSGYQPLDILEPLREASSDSGSIVLGYGRSQEPIRSQMVPYFHVCGGAGESIAVRALVVAGWLGNKSVSTLAAARLVAALDSNSATRQNVEATVYPVVNVEAARAGTALTPKQELEGIQLWKSSPCSHIRVLEAELLRYAYDVVVVLRENPCLRRPALSVWHGNSERLAGVIERFFQRRTAQNSGLDWQPGENTPGSPGRILTPLPRDHQPTEISIGVPSEDPLKTTAGIVEILLGALHAVRSERLTGKSADSRTDE